ncbi:hypothetical protein [Actinophytocola sediminis]
MPESGEVGAGIGFYRYQGFPLEEKIAWVAAGPGASALADAQSALGELGNDLIESEQVLRELVNSLGGEWSGSAGAAAGASMVSAANWSADSAPVTGEAGSQVGLQSESVTRTRYGMPGSAPQAEYGFGDAFGDAINLQTGNLFDVQTDFDEQVAQRRAADEEANRLLYAHEATTRATLAAIPALAEIAPITVDSTPPPTRPLMVGDQSTDWNTVPPVGQDERTDRRQEPRDDTKKPDREPVEPEPADKPTDKPADKPADTATPTDKQAVAPEQRTEQDQGRQPPPAPDQQLGDRSPLATSPTNSGVLPASLLPEPDRSHAGVPAARGGFGPTGGVGGGLGGGLPVGGFVGGIGTGGEPVAGGRGPGATAGAVPAGGARANPAGARMGAGAGRGAAGSLMGPAAGGARDGESEDLEHTDRFFSETDELFRTDDLLVLNHSVLGEDRDR